jgi:hypothetical protein
MHLKPLANRLKKLETIFAERKRQEREAAIECVRNISALAMVDTFGPEALHEMRVELERTHAPFVFSAEEQKSYLDNLNRLWSQYAGTPSDPSRVLTREEIKAVLKE